MTTVYQSCRVCGVQIPAGFTNCDGCYYYADRTQEERAGHFSYGSDADRQKLTMVSAKWNSRRGARYLSRRKIE
ncbi:MAG: hypothetical protein HQL11_02725 [Candidatus Omnitrophica bacterium]|nr:hypothetical protein [Candidatus Omnitrophota bacterium]